jgi:hypothetical protein
VTAVYRPIEIAIAATGRAEALAIVAPMAQTRGLFSEMLTA